MEVLDDYCKYSDFFLIIRLLEVNTLVGKSLKNVRFYIQFENFIFCGKQKTKKVPQPRG